MTNFQNQRTIKTGFFPGSPITANIFSIYSSVFSNIVGKKVREKDYDEIFKRFKDTFLEKAEGIDQENKELIWNAFKENYVEAGDPGGGGGPKEHMKPFHTTIFSTIGATQDRYFEFYNLLMTDECGHINTNLHQNLKDVMLNIESNNVFEDYFIQIAQTIGNDEVSNRTIRPVKPLVDRCGLFFREDLETLLKLAPNPNSPIDRMTTKDWFESIGTLFIFSFLMYYIQLSINLKIDFDDDTENNNVICRNIVCGGWDEVSTSSRDFYYSWNQPSHMNIENDVYNSHARLMFLKNANRYLYDNHVDQISDKYLPLRLKEIQNFDDDVKDGLIGFFSSTEYINDAYHTDLIDLAQDFVNKVNHSFINLPENKQSPFQNGVKVIKQLSKQIGFMKTATGETFRLSNGLIKLFVTIFVNSDTYEMKTFDNFIRFLEFRLISMDKKTIKWLEKNLDLMGLLEKQSDSGEATYVRKLV